MGFLTAAATAAAVLTERRVFLEELKPRVFCGVRIMSPLLTSHSLVEATVKVKVLTEEVLCFMLCFLSLLWSKI